MKKIVTLLLVLAICITLSVPAYAAQENILSRDEQIHAVFDSMDEESLYAEAEKNMETGKSECIFENISISCKIDSNDLMTRSEMPQIETGYAVREIGTVYDQYTGSKSGTVYAAAAVAGSKTTHSSDSSVEDRVITKLIIYWIDNLGPKNELLRTSGSWEYESTKEIKDKMVLFGTYNYLLGWDDFITRYPPNEKMEFDYTPTRKITGLTFASQASLYAIGYGTVPLLVITSIHD